jgi:site-specific DNA recombinase
MEEKRYCMYLRKSRKDDDVGNKGESIDETLARHNKRLEDLADRLHLNIEAVYKEVVSGDSIEARPVMKQLLKEIKRKKWTGVLVVEIERLARGETIDQGLIFRAFKYSKTLIITPTKTYDPTNPSDSKFFAINLMLSRWEYETTVGRMQDGRLSAAEEGWYVGNKPPYGYTRIKHNGDKGWTLNPEPEQAEVIKMIFDWYTTSEVYEDGSPKRIGVSLIARRLNQLKIEPTKKDVWVSSSVRDIIINPVYAGKIRWNWRPATKDFNENGELVVTRPRATNNTWTVVDGRHKGIIEPVVFELAQQIIKQNPARPIGRHKTVKNPLAGIVICGKCERRMVRRPYSNGYPDTLMCAVPECPTVSSHLHLVEAKIIGRLESLLEDYKLEWNIDDKPKKAKNLILDRLHKVLIKHDKEIKTLNEQLSSARSLVERGVYTDDEFIKRRIELIELIKQAEDARKETEAEIKTEETREIGTTLIVPTIQKVIDLYKILPTAEAKNDLLKEVLEKVVYTKDKNSRWNNSPDDFEVVLYPKLPISLKPDK